MTRSAEGMSLTTWTMQLFGFTASVIYNCSMGYPLPAWGETLVFSIQSAGILTFCAFLQGRLRTYGFALGCVVFAALLVGGCLGLPAWALSGLQATATLVTTTALLPQLVQNQQNRSAGGWSPVTASLSALGNGARVFTTLTLTRDPLLLTGFIAGLVINLTLLFQILAFGEKTVKPVTAD